MRRRNEIELIRDLLCAARKPSLKTRIQFKARLNFKSLTKLLPLLIRTGCIEQLIYKGRVLYRTTPKGLELMKLLDEIEKKLGERHVEKET